MPRRYTAHHPGATGGSPTGQTSAALIEGGLQDGNGGLIETSSHNTPDPGASLQVLASAPVGSAGNWLIDSDDITIDTTLAGTIVA